MTSIGTNVSKRRIFNGNTPFSIRCILNGCWRLLYKTCRQKLYCYQYFKTKGSCGSGSDEEFTVGFLESLEQIFKG